MNNVKRSTSPILLLLILILLLGMTGCVSSTAEELPSEEQSKEAAGEISGEEALEENTFYAEVIETESDFGGILVRPEDESMSDRLVIHSENMPSLSVGARVKIRHNGQIAMSYPGQIFGAEISVVE